ncbi:MAG TPA: hypothetical protein PK843_06380 [bacterium]|nr:hypothetical protein [bacterium]HPN34119.1 hypothetical protein [bacterium]
MEKMTTVFETDLRLEIVVLEDDPELLDAIATELERRGLYIHPFSRSQPALEKMLDEPRISVLLTDIEIREPFPNGPRSDLQGYDVVNRLYEQAPHRLFTAVVMTALDQESALDSANLFRIRPLFFSKHKWGHGADEKAAAFDQLAGLLSQAAQTTPNRWHQQVLADYPKSRWVCEKTEGDKTIPPLWEWYCRLWFSTAWPSIEKQIAATAETIVQTYMDGEIRKLRGDHLTLAAAPNENSFKEYLIGRRVVYALAALEPAYWEQYVRGEAVKEEEPLLSAEIWQGVQFEQTKELINRIHRQAAEHQLEKTHRDYTATAKKIEQLESRGDRKAEDELQRLWQRQRELSARLQRYTRSMAQSIQLLVHSLDQEPAKVRLAMVPFLRFWGADFSQAEWSRTDSKTGGGNDPLTQTLLLLGIRKQDVENTDPLRWKLLLPEERKWLQDYLSRR